MPRRQSVLSALLSTSVFLLVASCGGGDGGGGTDPGPPPDPVSRVEVNPSTLDLEVGETGTLSATVFLQSGAISNQSVTWSSSNTNVATVNGGTVTAVGEGVAMISAAAGGRTGTATVTVTDPNPPAQPTNVTASAVSDTEIVVTWDDNSNNETGFEIEREAVAGAPSGAGLQRVFMTVGEVDPNVTEFRDTGLNPTTTYRYRVNACNDNGCTESDDDSGDTETHETIEIQTQALPGGLTDVAYAAQLEATGGDGSLQWSLVGGAGELPPGLSLESDGAISGTPTTEGTFDFTAQVRSAEQTASVDLSITISEQILPPIVTTTELPDGVVGAPYIAQLEAAQGDGTFTWAITDGGLPPGMTFDGNTGTINNPPTAAGTFEFTVEVTSAELTGTADFSITVYEFLRITTESLSSGVVDTPYSQTVQVTGGDGNYTFSVETGDLPEGLSLNEVTGEISGTPTTTGTSDFRIRVTSGDGQATDEDFSITINDAATPPQVVTTELDDGVVGAEYGATLVATGGDGTFAWTRISGSLPNGLNLAADGTISGTPTAAGTFNFEVEVTSAGLTDTADLSITIYEALEVATTNLPNGVEGQPYDETLASSGGDGTTTWSLADGDLPAGLDLESGTGRIMGMPTAPPPPTEDGPERVGTSNFTVRAVSGDGQTATRALSISVFTPLVITTTSLPDGTQNTAYSETVAATGGDGNYTFSNPGAGLPTGLMINAAGTVSGTPTVAGTFNFTIQVVSTDGQTASRVFSITIAGAGGDPVVIETEFLQPGLVGGSYSTALVASGGDGMTYTWTQTGGTRPPGLELAGDGALTGTPTTPGEFTFTAMVSSGGESSSRSFDVVVVANDGSRYNITPLVVSSSVSDFIQTEVDRAIAKWEAAITGDITGTGWPAGFFNSSNCGGFGPILNGGSVDDVIIFIDIKSIDGPFGILAQAGPCSINNSSDALTDAGRLTLDSDDLSGFPDTPDGRDALRDVIFHEIGHVLGFGSLWTTFRSLTTGEGGTDPRFTGAGAKAEFATLRGDMMDVAVHLENDGGQGTADSHWEEDAAGANDAGRQHFGAEIMTGFAEPVGTASPLSRMTIASMADLGYVVDLGAADPYSLPTEPPPSLAAVDEPRRTFDEVLVDLQLLQRSAARWLGGGR